MDAKKGKRAWQPREMQMVAEWLAKTFPGDPYMTRVRLGTPRSSTPRQDMTPEELAMVGVWRRWADAVVILRDRILLIEAAIRPNPGKIGQLELYALLLPHTPEFFKYSALPVELCLLYAIEDPAVLFLARRKGIRCIEYKPSWLPDYMALLQPRERRGPKIGIPEEE